MQQLLILIHMLICFALIILVLIQHGKGADMGAGFGSGASQTMFGSAGSTPFLVKITGFLAAAFFVSCLLLTYIVSQGIKKPSAVDLSASVPVNVPQSSPASTAAPVGKVEETSEK